MLIQRKNQKQNKITIDKIQRHLRPFQVSMTEERFRRRDEGYLRSRTRAWASDKHHTNCKRDAGCYSLTQAPSKRGKDCKAWEASRVDGRRLVTGEAEIRVFYWFRTLGPSSLSHVLFFKKLIKKNHIYNWSIVVPILESGTEPMPLESPKIGQHNLV